MIAPPSLQSDILFQPLQLGELALTNRIIMSPMTRTRAGENDIATDLMVEYYRQRASAGLIVTEGVYPSRVGKGYWRMPGIADAAQIASWRKVADAVHAEGGKIVMQLMHCGRVVVLANRLFAAEVIAPSAVPCPQPVPGPDGVPAATAMPRAIAPDEIPALYEEFAQAARNARAAGIDGVELHAASGYLVHQFLDTASTQRSDAYGGSGEDRCRFAIGVLQAMADAIGAGRVGLRISPGNTFNGMAADEPEANFAPLLQAAEGMKLAYVHIMNMNLPEFDVLEMVRKYWSGPVLDNNGLTGASARELLQQGRAQGASFGRAFISNPDLPARLAQNAPLAPVQAASIYVGEERGYTDYPPLVASTTGAG